MQMSERMGAEHYGEERAETAEALAELIIAEELKRGRRQEADLNCPLFDHFTGFKGTAKGQGSPSGCPRASCILVPMQRFNHRRVREPGQCIRFRGSTTWRLGVPEMPR